MKFKLVEELKPNNEILETIKDYQYTVKNGAIKSIENTNLQFIKPITYLVTSPIKLTILEYRVNEVSGKPYYIMEYNQKYNLKELKQLLIKMDVDI